MSLLIRHIFAYQVKQLLEKVMQNLNSKEAESKEWKSKYNIQTQQERELSRTQPPPPGASAGVLA